jgi:hypothetical protein
MAERTGIKILLYDFYLYNMRRLRQTIFPNEAGRIAAALQLVMGEDGGVMTKDSPQGEFTPDYEGG